MLISNLARPLALARRVVSLERVVAAICVTSRVVGTVGALDCRLAGSARLFVSPDLLRLFATLGRSLQVRRAD